MTDTSAGTDPADRQQREAERRVRDALAALPLPAEVIDCDPEKADTAVFCRHYGYALEDSANTILVAAKTGERRVAACVLLADSRLDVNHVVRRRLAARRVSFADAERTRELTGMEIGGVTPLALPPELPIWVDARVMTRPVVVLGAGSRRAKVVVSPRLFEHLPAAEIVEGLALPAPQGAAR